MNTPHSTKRLDLTGLRFGKLTVIAPAENVGGRTAWLCRCECGAEHIVKTKHLRSGHVKSCGCVGGGSGRPGHARGALTFVDGTCLEMLEKNTPRRNNTSGVVGVEWMKKKHRWRATICFKGKRYYLGRYERFDDAVAARKKAEAEMHGAFIESMKRQRQKNV